MLRRRSSHDTDAVLAARRRLAAARMSIPVDGCEDEDPGDSVLLSADEAPTAGGHARHREDGFAVSVGRFVITPAQVATVALVLVIVMGLTCWWVIRSVPSSHDVQLASSRRLPSATAARATGSPGAAGAAPASGPAPTRAAPGVVVVDVAGKVRHPGVVELPSGSRVIDAIKKAGGARRHANTTSLNQARVLVDGEQILVGIKAPAGASPAAIASAPADTSGSAEGGGETVNLNTADESALEELPGVGPVTAQAIITWRTENGGFSNVDELMEVSGIGEVTLGEMRPLVTV